MATIRWYVELADGESADIGADSAEIRDGALIFTIGRENIGYAAHAWVSFTSEVVD